MGEGAERGREEGYLFFDRERLRSVGGVGHVVKGMATGGRHLKIFVVKRRAFGLLGLRSTG